MNTLVLSKYAYRPEYSKRGRPRKYPVLWDMVTLSFFSNIRRFCTGLQIEVGYGHLSETLLKAGYARMQRTVRKDVRKKFNLPLDEVSLEIEQLSEGPRLFIIAP